MIYSIGINAKLTLDMHSLNNEGGEGNQTLTRQVTITDESGNLHMVNAISGDMYKHIQAEHLYYIALQEKLPLCKSCEIFNPNRISGDIDFKFNKSDSDEVILDEVLKRCIIDDMEGILITSNNKNIPIKSSVEFGWVVGIPKSTKTENYFHVKLVPNSKKDNADDNGANVGQNIFHRPASSGQYAFVANIDCYRIGYNEITRSYPISDEDREKRFKALIKSMLYTLIKPTGAMRNTQNPHIVNGEGVITISKSSAPAPLVSPLNKEYESQIKNISNSLNKIEGEDVIQYKEFKNLAEFAEIMGKIAKQKPAKIEV